MQQASRRPDGRGKRLAHEPPESKTHRTVYDQMQSYGTPPTELMGVLPPGLDGAGLAGLGLEDKDCTIA